MLSSHTVTDPEINSISVPGYGYLQSSPEYLMKRLLAFGAPSIYSIGPAFRDAENGHQHRPEFTMLEWYRRGLNDLELIEEIKELLDLILGKMPYQELTYSEVLLSKDNDHQEEDLRFAIACEALKPGRFIIKDYPAEKAVLARIDEENPSISRRFEFVIDGLELANGYFELQDFTEHLSRFSADNQMRKQRDLPLIDVDPEFMASVSEGLPTCAGVAMGFDRLMMLREGVSDIAEISLF